MEKNSQKVTFGGNPINLLGSEAKTGARAKPFTLVNGDMKPVSSEDFKGKIKVLSIAPSIDTPVCAAQTRRFNQEAAMLSEEIVILSVSMDLPFALKRFCGAEGIDKVETLSDHKEADFGKEYGFLIEGLRLLARGILIIDKEDIIRYVEYVPEIGNEPDYKKAMENLRKIL